MRSVVTGKEMKAIDTYSIEDIGIPSLVLMERAAYAVAKKMTEYISTDSRILCICGGGNNGGDGVAVARILYTMGYQAGYFETNEEEKWTEETRKQIFIARNVGVTEYNKLDLSETDVVVDALFGIGLNTCVRSEAGRIIETLNGWRTECEKRLIWAVDIPSGISSKTGQILGSAVRADHTSTFGFMKAGLILYPGRAYAGTVYVEDIGFPQKALEENKPVGFMADVSDFKADLVRSQDSNKGTFGKVLVIAGSKNICGAAYFSAKAACYSGAGLVKVLTFEENRVILQSLLPQAMLAVWDEMAEADLKKQLQWADVIVLGPGIGTSDCMSTYMETVLREAVCPLVIDADGLNLLSMHKEWYNTFKSPVILTPHMGEMSRLTGETIENLKADRESYAVGFAKEKNCICVLKDSATVVSDGHLVYYNTNGNNGMSTGGSGDVLAGVIGALAAGGLSPFKAACAGVCIHGAAGDRAAQKYGCRSMTAEELIEGLAVTLKDY